MIIQILKDSRMYKRIVKLLSGAGPAENAVTAGFEDKKGIIESRHNVSYGKLQKTPEKIFTGSVSRLLFFLGGPLCEFQECILSRIE